MKIERKYLAHYIDASMGKGETEYTRLGKDLEEYNEELNPSVEVKKNILGEQSVQHSGYEAQSEVSPYYADPEDDPLYPAVEKIAIERLTGDACKTTKVDVCLTKDGASRWAYREDVYIIPTSVGGDTSGMQIPFTVYNAGNRVKGNWDVKTKTFTQITETAGE